MSKIQKNEVVDLAEWQSRISSEFSKAELDLQHWLIGHSESLCFLLSDLKEFMNNDIVTDGWFRRTNDLSNLSPKERLIGATLLIHEIREFSGNTFNFFTPKPHYEAVLSNVHKRLCKRYKKNFPEIASIEYRENDIGSMLMGEAINHMSAEDIEIALEGSNFEPTKESKKQALVNLLTTSGIGAAYKLIGKKVLKDLILKVVSSQLKKHLGEQMTKTIIKKAALKIPQKFFKGALGVAGVGFIVKDVIDLGGEATRFTTPMIINISVFRMLQREFQLEIGE